ncbi:MAG: TIM barrel protein [Oscillospiraceae bacterium]|nr:TIM barrel protein [Oscillospiraceae bacterium]
MAPKFGTAGIPESFYQLGYKKTQQLPEYLKRFNLNAFEYQCGRGVKISREAAENFGKICAEGGIQLSLHAPYYISLSSIETEKRENSIKYILESAAAAKAMGAKRVVVHSGSCSKMTREQALDLAKDTLAKAAKMLDENGCSEIRLCPETMGKVNQLGTLDEVLELCTIDERFIPYIDFGHLNARSFGGLKGISDYEAVFDAIENKLGNSRLKEFHSHFSKIEYTNPGGEKRHLTFADAVYGPDFEPLAELTAKRNCSPVFICESAGTQAEDALYMLNAYKQFEK